jgi:putative FmdB family regulatory protein
MPIFEYVCTDCHQSFEKLVSREESVKCPSCEGEHLEKQFSTFGLGATTDSAYPSLPQYKPQGGCCNPGSCGCKH